MDKFTYKPVKDLCFNCGSKDFTGTYMNGRLVEVVCNDCEYVTTMPPADDED